MTRIALAVIFAILPLYGTFAALAPDAPPIPPLVPARVTYGIGALAVLALVVLAVPGLRAARRADPWVTFGFVGGGAATLLSALAGFDPLLGVALGVLVTGTGLAALALLGADAPTRRTCIRAFLWSALAASLLALAMLVTKRPAALYAYNNGRAVGTFLNPNELAAYALVALGCALPLALVSRGRDRLATVTAVALVGVLLATFSRWGAVSAVCGVAVYALAVRSRLVFAGALVLAVAGFGLDAAAGARHHNPRDTEARAVAWRTGWTTFERFPLLGVGPLAYAKTYDELRAPDAPGPRTPVAFDPHSLPLAFAADGGAVAVLTLAVSAVVLQRRIYRAARGAPREARTLALGLAAALVALYVDSAINTILLFFPLGYQGVALALAVTGDDGRAAR